jgi:ATP-binding cassette subfamily B protein/subfamily B ATP-binding cassette protein MsbA
MAILIALSFVSTLFSFVMPLLTKSLVDDVFIGGKTELFGYILMATAGAYLISSLSIYISNFKKGELDLILFNNVSAEVFDTIQFASLGRIQEMKVGDLLSRIMVNTRSAINIFTIIVPEFLISAIRIVTPLLIMLSLDSQLTLFVMIPGLLVFIAAIFLGRRLERTQRISLEKTAIIYSFLKESLSMMPLIKVFALEIWSRDKFYERMRGYYDISLEYAKNSSLNSSVSSLMYGAPMVLLIFFGGPMVVNGFLTIGTFTAFMSYVALFFNPISQIAFLWSYYKSSSPAFDRVNEIFKLEPDDGGKEELIVNDGKVEFNDVCFSYGNRHILHDFNSTFARGLNYIVGDNGTGKSTVLKLLCLLYPLEKGCIRIDGHDISKVRRDELRKSISMIFSEPYIFDGSIYENIHIGNLSATKEEVIKAAKLVKVHEFIEGLSQGYETQVGESGLKLSSGERQKIALARAILKNSPIILLDEVTKSIDMESRESIKGVIKELMDKKTIIIVTHNANEIEDGNNIVYLEPREHRGGQASFPPIFISYVFSSP